jgi:hypothetical protein
MMATIIQSYASYTETNIFRVAKKIYVKFGRMYIMVKCIQKKNLHTQVGITMCCNLARVIRTTTKNSFKIFTYIDRYLPVKKLVGKN